MLDLLDQFQRAVGKRLFYSLHERGYYRLYAMGILVLNMATFGMWVMVGFFECAADAVRLYSSLSDLPGCRVVPSLVLVIRVWWHDLYVMVISAWKIQNPMRWLQEAVT